MIHYTVVVSRKADANKVSHSHPNLNDHVKMEDPLLSNVPNS